MALEESTQTNDTEKDVDGVTFIYDKNAAHTFEGKQLDYIKGMFGSGRYTIVE